MEAIRLNNVGRKFRKFINTEVPSGTDDFPRGARHADDFWALRNVYMNIAQKEIVACIGRNGSGKTTLLNIIAGTLPPSEGEVALSGRVSALLTLGAGFQDEFTGRENVYLNGSLLGLSKTEIEKRFGSILEFSELGDFINAPLGTYSSGMKMRLGFSIAVHNDFEILLTDEIIAVGDMYFQKKCFQKMTEFKRQGKAMLIATQDMELVRRFCDRAYLFEDGQVLSSGKAGETVEQYEKLLNKKKILSENSRLKMVRETKRWATDIPEWGKSEGTGEVLIKKIACLGRWGMETDSLTPAQKLTIRVYFEAKEAIDNFHFGVAIFREDGVYCYGPNTRIDGLALNRIGRGRGYFDLKIKEPLLCPGQYYISVAVWDEKEVFAYDYHKGKCRLEIKGSNPSGQLLCLPGSWEGQRADLDADTEPVNLYLSDKWEGQGERAGIQLGIIRFLNNYGSEDSCFVTGRDFKIKIDCNIADTVDINGFILWLGIYRSDGVYCCGKAKKISSRGALTEVLVFPKLKLLPGGYRASLCVFDARKKALISFTHGLAAFNMISDKQDHGTIYLDHLWSWHIPKGALS